MSIGIGAASGIGTTVADGQGARYTLGIGGGLLAAGLGLLTLRGGQSVPFGHPRNLLADVWAEKPAPGAFPPSVWYFLTEPAFSNGGQTSIAHNTRQRWQQAGPLAHPNSPAGQRLTALLFGAGGNYSADQLTMRANMLNQLQAAVRLLNQEMQALLQTVNESSH